MALMSIKIKDMDRVKRVFSYSPMFMTKQLNTAIQRSIIMIEIQSMINVPVITGTLRRSHWVQFGNLIGAVGTNTDYDVLVHEGTRFRKAKPFLRNALESNETNVNRQFTNAINNTLKYIADMKP